MNLLAHAQELARRFNENEDVQREFERLRLLRRLSAPFAALPEDVADDLDWRNALSARRHSLAFSLRLP